MNSSPDITSVIQIMLGVAAFLGGWLLKVLFARIDKLEMADSACADKLHQHIEKLEAVDSQLVRDVGQARLDLASNYVHKTDLQNIMAPIYDALRRIEDKLDKKADKEGP